MSKTIERIQAFIRLANNNPNDHEANAAARKVCKMIEEGKISLSDGVVKVGNNSSTGNRTSWTPNPTPNSGYSNPFTWDYDFSRHNSNYWDDFKVEKQKENERESKRREEERKTREANLREKETKNRRDFEASRRSGKEYFRQYDGQYKPIYDKVSPITDKIIDDLLNRAGAKARDYDYYTKEPKTKKHKETRILICKTCKQPKETVFLGLEQIYECNDCQWSAYERSKKE